jgi:biotin carboxyl carrier protein
MAVGGSICSPLPGVIKEINVKVGDTVKVGDKLLTLEAMKMENAINSDKAGVITVINVHVGSAVLEGHVLIELSK